MHGSQADIHAIEVPSQDSPRKSDREESQIYKMLRESEHRPSSYFIYNSKKRKKIAFESSVASPRNAISHSQVKIPSMEDGTLDGDDVRMNKAFRGSGFVLKTAVKPHYEPTVAFEVKQKRLLAQHEQDMEQFYSTNP